MMKKITAFTAFVLVLSILAGTVGAAFVRTETYTYGMFADVDEANMWYGADRQHVIKDVYELGIMDGVGDGYFQPDGNLTLAHAVTMAARVHSMYYGNTIDQNDYEKYWFEPYTRYSLEYGFMDVEYEYNDAYYWNTVADRVQMASIFARCVPESELQPINNVEKIPDFTDYEDTKPVLTLYNAGILSGNDGYGTFNAYTPVKRSEAAAIISRIAIPENRQEFTLLKYYAEGYTNNEVVDFFLYTALNAEFGGANPIMKWTVPIKVYIEGYMTDADKAQVNKLFAELNSIYGFPGISYADTSDEANMRMYFVDSYKFSSVDRFIEDGKFWGYARCFTDMWAMTRTEVLIDNVRSDQSSRTSIIAEEILQSLGLLNDNYDHPESIFYQYGNDNEWPATIDWACVKLLYHPTMKAGYSEAEARAAASAIITEFNNSQLG